MADSQFDHIGSSFLRQNWISVNEVMHGDIVVFGAPHGTPYPSGDDVPYELKTLSADAPDAIRSAANLVTPSIDNFDFDLGGPLLESGKKRLVDCGNLTLSKTDGPDNRKKIKAATNSILSKGGIPVLLGGDDSVPIPFMNAFSNFGPVDILQIDAHIDWRDTINGEANGFSNTMIRASENPFVRSITQIGMRGVGSARQAEVDKAHAWGAKLVTVSNVRDSGPQGIVDMIPEGGNLIIHIDCDALDISVCPAVNAPSPGGFQFNEVVDILRTVIAARRTVGFCVVELAPSLESNNMSAIIAARITCNVIGALARAK